MKPAISVIVPFYNIEQYVSYCLDSILAQTFRDFELICINDGSKDGTRELLDAYAEKDSRVKVIHQENQGVSAARNNGLQLAAGKYIAFIDGDDAVTPEYLEIFTPRRKNQGRILHSVIMQKQKRIKGAFRNHAENIRQTSYRTASSIPNCRKRSGFLFSHGQNFSAETSSPMRRLSPVSILKITFSFTPVFSA